MNLRLILTGRIEGVAIVNYRCFRKALVGEAVFSKAVLLRFDLMRFERFQSG